MASPSFVAGCTWSGSGRPRYLDCRLEAAPAAPGSRDDLLPHRRHGDSAFLLDASGVFGPACLLVIWTLTLTAAAIHLAWMSAPELLVGATFAGLGWAGGLALPWMWIHAGVVPGVLMLVGGLLYTAGALSCRRRTASW
jgi:hypothetical protein